jgi:DNA-binding transcriptional LysR family regulator
MLNFTLRQLEHFRAVAETGSFSAAGTDLHVSPSTVAASVNELERTLATRLFVRRKAHGVALTASGAHLLRRARSLLQEAQELALLSTDGAERLSGPIAIGCFSTLAASVLPNLLDGFASLHPDVELSFVDGGMDELLPLLKRAALDMLLTYRINLPIGLDEAVLYETEIHALLAASHALADAPAVSLHDLADEDLILLDLPPSGRHSLDMVIGAGITPKVRHRTQNFELVRSLVARGLGYSLLVQKPKISLSYEGLPLVTKRIRPESSPEAVVLTWPSTSRLTRRARALIDFAVETLRPQHISMPNRTKTR